MRKHGYKARESFSSDAWLRQRALDNDTLRHWKDGEDRNCGVRTHKGASFIDVISNYG